MKSYVTHGLSTAMRIGGKLTTLGIIGMVLLAVHLRTTAFGEAEANRLTEETRLTHWHLYLSTNNQLFFTDGTSTHAYEFGPQDDRRRFDEMKRFWRQIASTETKVPLVIVHAWHGDTIRLARSHLEEVLVELSSYELVPKTSSRKIAFKSPVPNPMFAVRFAYGEHTKATITALHEKGIINVPQSFLNVLPTK